MSSLLPMLATIRDLLLVILGFSLIVVVHELGHFLAARWAGVRVQAFAVGFGPAIVSYRKGLGVRRGSSEAGYNRMLRQSPAPGSPGVGGVSPTEYRLNALPFGGYVKMLGQDDVNPASTSTEPDSFQTCPVWKRMVIISAGVVMNVLLAAALFVGVFMVGLKTEPAIIGSVLPDKPAAVAVAVNAVEAGVTEPGLQAGDRVLAIDGERPAKFQDLVLAAAMARGGQPVTLSVQREGVDLPLRFEIRPEVDAASRLQMLGAGPLMSNRLPDARTEAERKQFATVATAMGVPGLEPGMTLKRVNGLPVESSHDLALAARQSDGQPIPAHFERDAKHGGGEVEMTLLPRPELMSATFRVSAPGASEVVTGEADHLVGLVPVLRVAAAGEAAIKAGLATGDIFSLLGTAEWPSTLEGIRQIRASKGETIRVSVVREQPDGTWKDFDLGSVPVSAAGTIGFTAGDSARFAPFVAGWPTFAPANAGDSVPSGGMLRLMPGSSVRAVGGTAVRTLADARTALIAGTNDASDIGVTVGLEVVLPEPAAAGGVRVERLDWSITGEEAGQLQSLGWDSPLPEDLFVPETTLLRASGPLDAIGMGLRETKSVMLTTYLTLARLFQGTVKVTHLKGPVGIAHVGTLLAGRGWDWLFFFMALISVNLAVINFLPIPIADGGHMVFLIYEQATGRPVSPLVQNVAALVGVVLLASMFLIVTFNDLRALLTGST